ncbi:MAG TPA: HEAT repeat domain-containing protein [Gemmatimonadales bacterium]|nr:HEAT repeat domain-containing protein [Gemmatimonadales bacterium]
MCTLVQKRQMGQPSTLTQAGCLTLPFNPGRVAQFADPFGRLVLLLRLEPANVPAQKEALRQAMTVLRTGTLRLETGFESSDLPDDTTLKGRLLSRRVEVIHFEAGASPSDVLFVARALAQDQAPLIGSPDIVIELLPESAPTGPRYPSAPQGFFSVLDSSNAGTETPSGRTRTVTGPVDESQNLARAFQAAAAQSYWAEALHAAQALVSLAFRFPEHERRGYQLSLRRLFNRKVLSELIVYALKANEEQRRVLEVLREGGPDAIELAIEHVASAEAVGPRRFLYDFLAQKPEAYFLLLPLLESSNVHTICHGVDLLGRIGVVDAIRPLRRLAEHPDPRVRQSVVQALARFREHGVIEPLRKALSDQSPGVRASAAHAIADRNSNGLAMPLLVALESEKDAATWRELVLALGRIDSAEAAGALVAMALDRKALLKSGGRPTAQRLIAVESLVAAGHPNAIRGLERVAREADGAVGTAAQEGLSSQVEADKTVKGGRGGQEKG